MRCYTKAMSKPLKILASTWNNGLFVLDDVGVRHELPNQAVRGLCDDLQGRALAGVDGNSLYQRDVDGNRLGFGGVYVSNNAGQQWQKKEEVLPGVSSVLIIN